MKASQWIDELQSAGVGAIQEAVLQAAKDGDFLEPCFGSVRVSERLTLQVSQRPLAVGEPGDFVFPMVSAQTAQRVLDELRFGLSDPLVQPTTKLLDEIRRSGSVRIDMPTQPASSQKRKARGYSPDMADARAMQRMTDDLLTASRGYPGVWSAPFKVWALTNRLLEVDADVTAFNYGGYSETATLRTASGLKAWQPLGGAHGPTHFDYSQLLTVVHPLCLLDGEWVPVRDVGEDPELWQLVSDEGVVKVWRQPSVVDPETGERPKPVEPRPEPAEPLSFDRMLRLESPYQRGEDVREWQRFLRVSADGVFGPQTSAATRAWQRSSGLIADGIVGPASLAKANEQIAEMANTNGSAPEPLVSAFQQAQNYRHVDRSEDIRQIVLHTAEIAELPTSAEALMQWAARPGTNAFSWHYAVDADSITQSVRDQHEAWHAAGANRSSIGIEMSGRSRQTAAEWQDEYSRAVLERTARLVAHLAAKWAIPLVEVTAAQLRDAGDSVRAPKGITTHAAVTMAYGKSTHMDPGDDFPMTSLLRRAREILEAS